MNNFYNRYRPTASYLQSSVRSKTPSIMPKGAFSYANNQNNQNAYKKQIQTYQQRPYQNQRNALTNYNNDRPAERLNKQSNQFIQKKYTYQKQQQEKRQNYYVINNNIGLVGLNNIGNTCYMNSILQCLMNLPNFNNYFLQNKHLRQIKTNSKLPVAYAKLVTSIKSTSKKSQTPSQVKNAVALKKNRFSSYAQQDAQQFLTGFLQVLSSQLNRSKNPKYKQLTADLSKQSLSQISDNWWNYNKQRQDSIVCDYFTGQLLSKVICNTCSYQSIAFDNTQDLCLNFSKDDNGDIMKMIQIFLKQQSISSDYYCSRCKKFRTCRRKLDLYRLPNVLVIQLKRFSFGKYSKHKLNNKVKVPVQLNLAPLINFKNQTTLNSHYKLVGVVNHSGDIDFGHYTADCRNQYNNKWYCFNDSYVTQINIGSYIDSSSPYLLFFSKKL